MGAAGSTGCVSQGCSALSALSCAMHGELEYSGEEIPQQPGSHRHTPGQGGGSTEPFTPALLAPHVSMALHHLSPKNTTRDSLLTVASSPTQGKHQAALALPLPITKHEASPAEVPPKAACSACFGPSPVAAT